MNSGSPFYKKFGKPVFDFSLAAAALLLSIIPQALIAFLVKLTSPGPAFFRHERVGQYGEIFRVVKFRTMTVGRQPRSPVTVAGSDWITPVGLFLRKWKLDEIPQLWNIVKGEMSFVGPRPDVPGFADELRGDDRRFLLLKPGITGPASIKFADEEQLLARVEDPVRYNNEVLFPMKVKINLDYLDQCSFLLDLEYIWVTIRLVYGIKRK